MGGYELCGGGKGAYSCLTLCVMSCVKRWAGWGWGWGEGVGCGKLGRAGVLLCVCGCACVEVGGCGRGGRCGKLVWGGVEVGWGERG